MDHAELFVRKSRSLINDDLLPKIKRCIDLLSDDQIWWRPNQVSNSIGNLLLHLEGNIRQWILSGIGGETDRRQRQLEFDERGPIERQELMERLTMTLAAADQVLSRLDKETLLEQREIQGKSRNVLEAIYHVVEHLSMHTGQIILLTKTLSEVDMGFYGHLAKAAGQAIDETKPT